MKRDVKFETKIFREGLTAIVIAIRGNLNTLSVERLILELSNKLFFIYFIQIPDYKKCIVISLYNFFSPSRCLIILKLPH